MPKQVHFLLKLDQETAYELQSQFQRSELDFPTFLAQIVQFGLGKYDLFLYPGTRAEYDAEVEDAFMLEWTIEREEQDMHFDEETEMFVDDDVKFVDTRTPEEIALCEEAEAVLAQADIVAIIGRSVELKQVGNTYRGICPFRGGDQFNVSPTHGIFYCFDCHASGDVLRYLMLRERLSFPEAIQRVRTLTEEFAAEQLRRRDE